MKARHSGKTLEHVYFLKLEREAIFKRLIDEYCVRSGKHFTNGTDKVKHITFLFTTLKRVVFYDDKNLSGGCSFRVLEYAAFESFNYCRVVVRES
ncbi:MAG: hypothetical protein Greene041614_876 [Parcubacteria group bacterium Greene0416_14]|nr:MAG: hypothetical protein Greene041614_876 [Parcubacteria group bacterium Greene0416_14]